MISLTCFLICLWLTSFVSDCIAFGANFHDSYNTSTPLDLNMSTAEENRIFKGEVVGNGEATYVVFVKAMFKNGEEGACTGSLIAPDAVVTAAHCVLNNKAPRKKLPPVTVTVGSKFSDNADYKGRTILANAVHLHQDFSTYTLAYDVAVIRLEDEVPNHRRRRYIGLRELEVDLNENNQANVYGWGSYYTNSLLSHELLRGKELKLVDVDECKFILNRWKPWSTRKYKVTDNHLCVQSQGDDVGEDGPQICRGDDGGPLIQDRKLIGIASWAPDACDGKRRMVYTRVDVVRDFINQAAELGLDDSGSDG